MSVNIDDDLMEIVRRMPIEALREYNERARRERGGYEQPAQIPLHDYVDDTPPPSRPREQDERSGRGVIEIRF